jgi:hypothetical protein
VVAARESADARRVLQLVLAGLPLLDGVLQYQASMVALAPSRQRQRSCLDWPALEGYTIGSG